MGHASLEPGGSDSLGLKEISCGVVWIWLDQRVSLRVRVLPSRGSTEWSVLILVSFWLDLAHREDAEGRVLMKQKLLCTW